MKKQLLLSFVGLALIVGSCTHFPKDPLQPTEEERAEIAREEEERELRKAIRKRLDLVHDLLYKNKIEDADRALRALENQPSCADEVALLKESIANARRRIRMKGESGVSKQDMMNETEVVSVLPSTYGKTVVIDSSLKPIELPEGPMEELVNKRITVHLENASIAELVSVLNEEGMNVLADDALQGDKTLTIHVQDLPVKELFSYIARNMGVAFHLGENLVWVTQSDETNGGPQMISRIIRLPQGFVPIVPGGDTETDNELEEVLNSVLEAGPAGASFHIFRDRNILVVRSSTEHIRQIEEFVREFDKPPLQVAIEARFVTIAQSDLRDLGAQLKQSNFVDGKKPTDKEGAKETNFLTELGALTAGAEKGVGVLNLSGVIADRTFDVLISAIDEKSSSTTLSVPRITVMNNRTARIRKGENVYYFEEYDVESIDRGDRGTEEVLVPSGSPTELPLGITFSVRVNIGNDGKTVMLGLNPQVLELLKWEDYTTSGSSSSGNNNNSSSSSSTSLTQIKLPRTKEQSVTTTVTVASGQTVVMGGMIDRTDSTTVKKIPLLGDLPLLGVFFRHTEVTSEPKNLLIFVTATIINDHGEFVQTVDAEAEAAE